MTKIKFIKGSVKELIEWGKEDEMRDEAKERERFGRWFRKWIKTHICTEKDRAFMERGWLERAKSVEKGG